jgi:tetratricopeptide (TPR) repeat protein
MSLSGSTWAHWQYRLRALAWLVIGRREEACTVFGAMLARWPNDAYALASRAHVLAQLGRRDQAILDSQHLVFLHPKRSAADWFNLAFLLETESRLIEAEQAFQGAVALDPKLDRAWYGLGLVLIRLQKLDAAVAALKRNTELQPMSPYGWYQLARVHAESHRPDEVMSIIRHLRGFEPKVAAQLERETGLQA